MGCDLLLETGKRHPLAALVSALIAAEGQKVKQKRALLDG
jgi:hypothetical protein